MSKVKIKGNASGTGVLTIEAPNTDTDRTITLPDEDITLGGGVDGIVSTANATAITIDSSENVGVGTSSPSVALQVEDSDFHQAYFKGTSTVGGIRLGNSVYDNGFIYYDNGANMLFNTNSTERMRITSDGRGLSQFTAKAWVNFNGTGTVAIRDSHNVSSITDNGTGDYTITLSNAMANTNWCPVITHRDATYEGMSAILGEALTTTTVRLGVRQGHVTAPPRQDTSLVAMVAFGD